MTPGKVDTAAVGESADALSNRSERRRLSVGWLLTPVILGSGLVCLAVVSNVAWDWQDIWPSVFLDFGTSLALVSVIFLVERRFERLVSEKLDRRTNGVTTALRRRQAEAEATEEALQALVISLVDATGVGYRDLDVSAYRRRGWPRPDGLDRVARFSLRGRDRRPPWVVDNLADHAMRDKASVVVADLDTLRSEDGQRAGIRGRAAMAFPVVVEDVALGVLLMDVPEPRLSDLMSSQAEDLVESATAYLGHIWS